MFSVLIDKEVSKTKLKKPFCRSRHNFIISISCRKVCRLQSCSGFFILTYQYRMCSVIIILVVLWEFSMTLWVAEFISLTHHKLQWQQSPTVPPSSKVNSMENLNKCFCSLQCFRKSSCCWTFCEFWEYLYNSSFIYI